VSAPLGTFTTQVSSESRRTTAALSAQAPTIFADITGLIMTEGTIEKEQPENEELP
jgi:hypothetical protein